jgi:hypothetical protein
MSILKANRIENLTTTDGGINVNNSGQVGVGTSSPGANLEVRGSSSNGQIRIGGSTSGTYSQIYSDNDGVLILNADQGNNAASSYLGLNVDNSERLRIDSSGRLLIGITSNYASSNADDLVIGSSSSSTERGITLGSTVASAIRFADAGNASAGMIQYVHNSGGTDYFNFYTAATERMRIDGSGRVGIGTTATQQVLTIDVNDSGTSQGSFNGINIANTNTTANNGSAITFGQTVPGNSNARIGVIQTARGPSESQEMFFGLLGSGSYSERMRIDSSGNVGINTTSPSSKLHVVNPSGGSDTTEVSTIERDNSGYFIKFIRDAGSGNVGGLIGADSLGTYFTGGHNTSNNRLYIDSVNDRMLFSTAGSERMRITSNGSVLMGQSSVDLASAGFSYRNNSGDENAAITTTRTGGGGECLNLNRQSSDGNFITFYQASTAEGSISVSGSTVSYNGGHISRWSQLAGGAERIQILRGSVLSNLDEMCEWGEEDNEQLNRMKVSDVEGDANVAGVFMSWDDHDDTYTNDFYCAMTGDFIIRIAQGTTVARGDLLMSAGDGTAKPQDDDIVRSKTIAKVTSTTVSTTYSDGSYCVPCVLMAC